MNKDFLNDVEFTKDVKIKKPKKPPTKRQLVREKEARKSKRFRKKLARLIYFILFVVLMGYISIMSCNGFISTAAGKKVTIFDVIGAFVEGCQE